MEALLTAAAILGVLMLLLGLTTNWGQHNVIDEVADFSKPVKEAYASAAARAPKKDMGCLVMGTLVIAVVVLALLGVGR